MELMMYLGNDLIEKVSINQQMLSKPGYLGTFKRQLKLRYNELIQQANAVPEFFVINMVAQQSMSQAG